MPVDASARIAPTARIHPEAVIGPGCIIGEYCVIEEDVALGPGCRLEPYVYIKRWTTLGEENEVSAGTSLGTDPLDKNFNTRDRSYLRIGRWNKIREHFTISRGTKPESETVIGDGNYIMTSGHIAHDCRIGDNNVICSCALLAGYVDVGDGAFISGGVVVHQYSKIGGLAMVGGNSRVNLDLPPFLMYSGFHARPVGLNLVGLRRAGMSASDIQLLKKAYHLLFRTPGKLEELLDRVAHELASEPTRQLVEFIRSSKRGITREKKVRGGD